MKKTYFCLLIILQILYIMPAAAGTLYREMKTIHFDVFFPEGMEKTAAQTGVAAEKAYAKIADKLNHEMSVPVPVFLSDENCRTGTELLRTSSVYMNRAVYAGEDRSEKDLSMQVAFCFLYDYYRQQGMGPLSAGSIPDDELKAEAERLAAGTETQPEPFFDFTQTVFADYDPWQNMYLTGSAGLHLLPDREHGGSFSLMADDILGTEKLKFSGAWTGRERNLNPDFLLSWNHSFGAADGSLSAFIKSTPVLPETEKFRRTVYEPAYGTKDTEEQGFSAAVSVPGKMLSFTGTGGLSRCSSPEEAAAGLLKLKTSGEINHILSGNYLKQEICFRASAGLIKFLNGDSPLYAGDLSFLWNLGTPGYGSLTLKGFAGAVTGDSRNRMPLFFNVFNGPSGTGLSGIRGRKMFLASPEYSMAVKSSDLFRCHYPFICEISLKAGLAEFTSSCGNDIYADWGAGLKFVFFPSLILKLDALVPVKGKSKQDFILNFSASCYFQQG